MTEYHCDECDEAMKAYHEMEVEQCRKDAAVLTEIKRHVSNEIFKTIETELKESEHHCNYRIVDNPIGIPQEEEGHYTIWIDQSGGESGGNYSGTICMGLPDGTYLMWNYWM